MTEKPIIFSGPMVRALLAGLKTQTRRVVKRQKHPYGHWLSPDEIALEVHGRTGAVKSPYGRPGDRLWVRETWTPGYYHDADHEDGPRTSIIYRANGTEETVAAPNYELAEQWRWAYSEDGDEPPRWRPSIHMPRWSSRITLEITDVRVERLRQITGSDAVAEGVRSRLPDCGVAQNEFRDLWDAINAKRGHGWETNPWVWVIEFKRLENKS